MGNEGKPKKPEVEKTFVFDPTQTTRLGGPFAEFQGKLSVEKPERPIPDAVKQAMTDERARAEAQAPKTPEAWYLKVREHLDKGKEELGRAQKLESTGGSLEDIENALLRARAQWIDAQGDLPKADAIDDKSNLNETERLLNELGNGIADARRQLIKRESQRR